VRRDRGGGLAFILKQTLTILAFVVMVARRPIQRYPPKEGWLIPVSDPTLDPTLELSPDLATRLRKVDRLIIDGFGTCVAPRTSGITAIMALETALLGAGVSFRTGDLTQVYNTLKPAAYRFKDMDRVMWPTLLLQLNQDPNPALLKLLQQTDWDYYHPPGNHLIPGVKEFLQWARAAGHFTALASDCTATGLAAMRELGLTDTNLLFHVIGASCLAGWVKSPEWDVSTLYEWLVTSWLGFDDSKIAVVDDQLRHLESATKMYPDITTVHVLSGNKPGKPTDFRPTLVIPALPDLRPILEAARRE
jgi:phosphoglycolate phosphatase-like HAD superfamily hydrolase